MKNSKFLPIILLLALLLTLSPLSAPAAAVDAPTVSAPYAMVLDRAGGAVLYEKSADARIYPASTTKIMTALLAVEAVERGEIDPDAPVTATSAAMEGLIEEGSSAGIRPGETLTLRQLLYCTMVASANEAANVIACRLAGDLATFAEWMNARAAALGCAGTHFTNAHGLPDGEHYTTLRDMSRIALEAMRHPLFAEVCATADVEIPATNLSGARSLHNSNALLSAGSVYGSGYVYAGTCGVKTGHTSAAGYCLVSAMERGGAEVMALVFGCESADACFRESAALFDWTCRNYTCRDIAAASECVKTVPVREGVTVDYVDLCPAEDFRILLPNEFDPDSFTKEITIFGADSGGMLTGPLASGAVLGRMELMAGGVDYGGVDLVPAASSALVMDRRTGEILFGKGLDSRVYPADTAKLMTALLAAEAVEAGRCSYNDMVTVTDAIGIDLDESSTRCGLQSGEQLTLETLLQCLLIASGDDAANAVAEFIGGTVPDFVAKMNERAASLGCTATAFTNAHGAYSDAQYTTARDFRLIAMEVTRHERLMRICGTAIAELQETNLGPARTLKNTNALICDESPYGADYVYENADGLKSGYNPGAGYALAATASRGGMDLLCLVFGGTKEEDGGFTCFQDTVTLLDWVFNNYSYQEVLKSTENIASVDIALGMDASYVNLRPATSITVLLPNDYDPAQFQREIRVYALENHETVTAPVTAGQVLGEVTLTGGGRSYGTVKLVASSSVQLSRIQYIRQQLRATTQQRSFRMTVIILALLFLLYLIWVLVYRIKRIRHVRAVRAAERERLLRSEAVMKHAEGPKSPGIRFFNERGVTEPQQIEAAPEKTAPLPPASEAKAGRAAIDVPIDDGPLGESAPAEAPAEPEKIVQLFPSAAQSAPETPESAPQPAAPVQTGGASGDLLAGAVLVATMEPPAARQETPEERAERDYFEEFFRPKK